jgi:hypothetical protein
VVNISMSLAELILIILVAAIVGVTYYYVFQKKRTSKKEQKIRIQPKLIVDEIIPNLEIIKTPGSPVVQCKPNVSLVIQNIGFGRAMNVEIEGYVVFEVSAPDKSIASCFYFSNRPQNDVGSIKINNMSIKGDSGQQTVNMYIHGFAVSDKAIDEGIRLQISYTDIYCSEIYTDIYDEKSCVKMADSLAPLFKKTLSGEVRSVIWPDSERIYLGSGLNSN